MSLVNEYPTVLFTAVPRIGGGNGSCFRPIDNTENIANVQTCYCRAAGGACYDSLEMPRKSA